MILLTNDLKSRLRRNARAIIDMNEQNKKENRADELTDFGFSKVKEADKEKAKKQVPLRLSASLYDELARWAEDEFRSVNGQIEYLLTEAVRKRKKVQTKDDE